MRSAVAGRHVLWRSQVSRSPTAACGGHPQRSSRIAAAACARRAPCEPFEAAPSFLCHGVVAARKSARCQPIANFTLCGKPRRASNCVLLRQSQCLVDFGLWAAVRLSRGGLAESSAGGTGRRRTRSQDQWAAAWPKNAKRSKTRGKHHHPSARSRRGGRRPVATRAPAGAP